MTKIRDPKKYNISKYEFRSALYYALQYRDWKAQYEALQGLSAVAADGMPHSSTISNTTALKGEKAAELSEKMKLIEDTVREADRDIYAWLLMAVTSEDMPFWRLEQLEERIPCGKNRFYQSRRKFYYLLTQKMAGRYEQTDGRNLR